MGTTTVGVFAESVVVPVLSVTPVLTGFPTRPPRRSAWRTGPRRTGQA